MIFHGQQALDVAQGIDRNGLTQVYITGRNSDIDIGSEDIVDAGGLYTQFAAAAAVHVSSSNNADDKTLTIVGLDANGLPQIKTIALVGQTETAVTGTWSAINSASLSAACAGDVYIYEDDTVAVGVPQTTTKVRAKIIAADTMTHMGVYTVPAGYNGFLCEYTSNQADVQLWSIPAIGGALAYMESLQGRRLAPRHLPAGTFVKLRCTATADNQDVRATMLIILRKG